MACPFPNRAHLSSADKVLASLLPAPPSSLFLLVVQNLLHGVTLTSRAVKMLLPNDEILVRVHDKPRVGVTFEALNYLGRIFLQSIRTYSSLYSVNSSRSIPSSSISALPSRKVLSPTFQQQRQHAVRSFQVPDPSQHYHPQPASQASERVEGCQISAHDIHGLAFCENSPDRSLDRL